MKKLVISVLCFGMLLFLVGCSSMVKETLKFEDSIATIVKDSKLTPECKVGIADGLMVAVTTDGGTRLAVDSMKKMININGEEYKKCYIAGAFASFLKNGVKDEVGSLLKDLVSIGTPLPTK